MKSVLQKVVKHFAFEGKFAYAYRYGSGHINDTYLGCFKNGKGIKKHYIIQKINNNVFTEPEKLMQNIEGVTNHMMVKIEKKGGDSKRETLNIIPTIQGNSYHKNEKGEYWRVYRFIENAHTYDVVEKKEHFYNAGKAFGKFQENLSDFSVNELYETIPNFHNTKARFENFLASVEKDPFNRAKDIKTEIEFALKREGEVSVIVDLIKAGNIPLHVTHNDTKFNNVMIDDDTGEGICVVDLDTVMPGSSLYDFGDAIRFGTNPVAEDEKNLNKVCMDLELYEYYTHGYLDCALNSLNHLEIQNMPFSAKLMTFECGLRFLTDYLNGDVYFKIHRDGHNLDRARTQLKLVTEMEEKEDKMKAIIEKYINSREER